MTVGPREVSAIRHCYARHNRGDDTGWLDIFDDDIVMSSSGVSFFEDGTWRGRDEVARYFVKLGVRSTALYRFRHGKVVEFVVVPTRRDAHAVLRR